MTLDTLHYQYNHSPIYSCILCRPFLISLAKAKTLPAFDSNKPQPVNDNLMPVYPNVILYFIFIPIDTSHVQYLISYFPTFGYYLSSSATAPIPSTGAAALFLNLHASSDIHPEHLPKTPNFSPWGLFLTISMTLLFPYAARGLRYALIMLPRGPMMCSRYSSLKPSAVPTRRANAVPASAMRRASLGWDSAHSNFWRRSERSILTGT